MPADQCAKARRTARKSLCENCRFSALVPTRPAVLFVTGDNDHRVNPAHSRKMTAELQAATTSGLPVLLRTNANAGHGVSTDKDEALEERADIYSFLFAQLGIAINH
jgi:prolyl oligopeptidase PreP (S9A serine peptidase family)